MEFWGDFVNQVQILIAHFLANNATAALHRLIRQFNKVDRQLTPVCIFIFYLFISLFIYFRLSCDRTHKKISRLDFNYNFKAGHKFALVYKIQYQYRHKIEVTQFHRIRRWHLFVINYLILVFI